MRNLENIVSGAQKYAIPTLGALLASAQVALSDVKIAFDPSPSSPIKNYILTVNVQGGQTLTYGIATNQVGNHIEKVVTGLPVNKVCKMKVKARAQEGTNIVESIYSNQIEVVNAAVNVLGVQTNSLGQPIVYDVTDKTPPRVVITNAVSLSDFVSSATNYSKGTISNPFLVGGSGNLTLLGEVTDTNWVKRVDLQSPGLRVLEKSFTTEGGYLYSLINFTNQSPTNLSIISQDFVDNLGTNNFAVRRLQSNVDTDGDGMSDQAEFDIGRNPYENLDHLPPVLNIVYGSSLGDYLPSASNKPKGSIQNPFLVGKDGYIAIQGDVFDTNGVKTVNFSSPIQTIDKFFLPQGGYFYAALGFNTPSITNMNVVLEDNARNLGTNNYSIRMLKNNVDTDGDGMSDQAEFDIGRNPYDAYDKSFVEIYKTEENDIVVHFSAEYRFEPVEFRVYTSTNLVDWEPHTENLFIIRNGDRKDGYYIDRDPKEKQKFYRPQVVP